VCVFFYSSEAETESENVAPTSQPDTMANFDDVSVVLVAIANVS